MSNSICDQCFLRFCTFWLKDLCRIEEKNNFKLVTQVIVKKKLIKNPNRCLQNIYYLKVCYLQESLENIIILVYFNILKPNIYLQSTFNFFIRLSNLICHTGCLEKFLF